MRKIPGALAPFLFLPGHAYASLASARNYLYATGILPRNHLSRPVISIGNITLGGSGKTPLVLYIAREVAKLGFTPAVLSRGYKRRDPGSTRILEPSEEVPDAARVLGDEPALIRRHLPGAWMGVSGNRSLAGAMIAKRQPGAVFILDDGFQHRRLCRDLDIVVLDGSQPLASNRVFPGGTLREPLSGLRRCHAVVLNGAPAEEGTPAIEDTLARYAPNSAVFCCDQTIESLVPFSTWKDRGFASEAPRSAFLVTALGNPARFRADVERLGIEVRGTRFYPDHHWLSLEEWRRCAASARDGNAEAIVTTEKDAIKIANPPDFPLLVSVQSTVISDANAFEKMLADCLGGRR